MKSVVQRVSRAAVLVDGEVVGEIGRGFLILLGVERGDGEADVTALAHKISGLRLFPDRTPMDLALADVDGACLVVSQFTLSGRVRKGRRPSFSDAEDPPRAEQLYGFFLRELSDLGLTVASGRFGARMQVELTNDGPVTLLVDSRDGVIQ